MRELEGVEGVLVEVVRGVDEHRRPVHAGGDRARDASSRDRAAKGDLRFEIRWTGTGGGVWTVHVRDGECTDVRAGQVLRHQA